MGKQGILFALVLLSALLVWGCSEADQGRPQDGDSADGDESDGDESDGDSGDGDAPDGDEPEDGDTPPARFALSPPEMNGFGHETLTLSDTECAFHDGLAVSVQEIPTVLLQVSEDGCTLSVKVQGGQGGPAAVVLREGDTLVAAIDGFSYTETRGEGLFERSWAIGDSLGAAMVSSYMSYDAQVDDGMFAFFFRQAGAFFPHPLVRMEGVPARITLADLDALTGKIALSALLNDETLPYFLGLAPLSDLRLNPDQPFRNYSLPGMHDVTWPFRGKVYQPGPGSSMITKQLSFYEDLLRFPNGVPENPTPIMDIIEEGQPTFVIVSMGLMAYTLLGDNYVFDDKLDADLDVFLGHLAGLDSAPVVLLGTMVDAAAMPGRPFTYAERYENIRINNRLYAAVERINAGLDTPRFFVAPLGEFFWDLLEAQDRITLAGRDYPVIRDASGRARVNITDSDDHTEAIGMGRFQGFFSLDHIHLTPTGHAMAANMMIEALNAALGPDSANPRYADALPYVDLAPILARDPMTETRLQAEAARLGIPDLASYLDPLPPPLSDSERCAFTHGVMAVADKAGCPASVQLEVNAAPCTGAAIQFPATVTVTVRDRDGNPLPGAAIGAAALPAANHGIMRWLEGGVGNPAGELTFILEGVGSEQAGGRLFVQSGEAVADCPLP